jgi:mono/diheme cytochrome c family protein
MGAVDHATVSLPARERPMNTGCAAALSCRRLNGLFTRAIFAREGSLFVTHKHAFRRSSHVLMVVVRPLFLGLALATALTVARSQGASEQKPVARRNGAASGKEIFVKYCASCHGTDGSGSGPAAAAMKTPPPDLTTLARRHEGKYPAGYVGALLKFGHSLASHGSEDMPVWGLRFKEIDPARDPTGQQHIDDVVAYIASIQAK